MAGAGRLLVTPQPSLIATFAGARSAPAAAVPKILDIDGLPAALAAFGLRQLTSAYTGPALTITRRSDNATLALGFTGSGDLDLGAWGSFAPAEAVYVTAWDDQAQNGLTAAQATTAHQPPLTRSRAQPGVVFSAAAPSSLVTSSESWPLSALSFSAVVMVTATGLGNALSGLCGTYKYSPTGGNAFGVLVKSSGAFELVSGTPSTPAAEAVGSSATAADMGLHVLQGTVSSAGTFLYGDGTALHLATAIQAAVSSATAVLALGNDSPDGSSGHPLDGTLKELLLWPAVLSAAQFQAVVLDQLAYWSVTHGGPPEELFGGILDFSDEDDSGFIGLL